MSDPILLDYAQEQAKRAKRLPLMKAELIKALATIKASRAVIQYDGCGDNGQIESVEAFRANGKAVSLNTPPFELTVEGSETTGRYSSLRDALDDYAWELLAVTHDGFENDDGGYGSITIDVAKAAVTLDHNDRFTDSVNTVTDV
jgi:hypothetical protein